MRPEHADGAHDGAMIRTVDTNCQSLYGIMDVFHVMCGRAYRHDPGMNLSRQYWLV